MNEHLSRAKWLLAQADPAVVADCLDILDDVDRRITPEHVTRRFQELLFLVTEDTASSVPTAPQQEPARKPLIPAPGRTGRADRSCATTVPDGGAADMRLAGPQHPERQPQVLQSLLRAQALRRSRIPKVRQTAMLIASGVAAALIVLVLIATGMVNRPLQHSAGPPVTAQQTPAARQTPSQQRVLGKGEPKRDQQPASRAPQPSFAAPHRGMSGPELLCTEFFSLFFPEPPSPTGKAAMRSVFRELTELAGSDSPVQVSSYCNQLFPPFSAAS